MLTRSLFKSSIRKRARGSPAENPPEKSPFTLQAGSPLESLNAPDVLERRVHLQSRNNGLSDKGFMAGLGLQESRSFPFTRPEADSPSHHRSWGLVSGTIARFHTRSPGRTEAPVPGCSAG